ncbi:MAG: hypothetical protein Q9191_001139 [Dirinaria sp. TL-2023a]
MSGDAPDHDVLITQFTGLTGVAPHEAEQYLATNQWDLPSAAAEYYTSLEEAAERPESSVGEPAATDASVSSSQPEGGRPVGANSAPQPIPTVSDMPPVPSSSSQQPHRKKFATLGDLGAGPPSHAGHGHDSDEDDEDDAKQDLFAGGEKSGLAVQNPDDLKRKILERARKNAPRPGGDEPRAPSSNFTGTARTLGGDDAPSRVIEDPIASAPQRPALVERHLHFWEDGFSVDDGPLYRTDDPANADILAMIRQGRAPLHIMNVEHTQEVDVKLEQHAEKYKPPKKKYKPFSGGGQRLGSPTPGPSIDSRASDAPAINTADPAMGSASAAINVDESQPTVSLQVRLGDGTRLVSRFNATHTIGDVYNFVNASSPAGQARAWVLMTTFPSKELQDKAQALGNISGFKRGGVVVQKWQ